jgi:beta-galactosidase
MALPRKFGSRRHYDFSHDGYLEECKRITLALAKAFGAHPGIAPGKPTTSMIATTPRCPIPPAARNRLSGNGCSGNTSLPMRSTVPGARCSGRWRISEFGEVELPNLTVTEANPAHVMDFRRYASDMVVRFNKAQADIIRAHSPGRDVIHNFMGRTLAFDHFDVGADLDISRAGIPIRSAFSKTVPIRMMTGSGSSRAPAILISRPSTMISTAPLRRAAGG